MTTRPGIDGREALEDETSLLTRTGLPAHSRWVAELFDPASWAAHPNYQGLASFWLQVHRGIRDEAAALRGILDRFRDGGHDPALFERAFAGAMERYLGHLEFHHQIEDQSYFPRFRRLDARLAAGFDLLEADHQVIHEQLVEVADSARLLLGSVRSPRPEALGALEAHSDAAERLVALLDRHLGDEEELVIPVILKHGDGSGS